MSWWARSSKERAMKGRGDAACAGPPPTRIHCHQQQVRISLRGNRAQGTPASGEENSGMGVVTTSTTRLLHWGVRRPGFPTTYTMWTMQNPGDRGGGWPARQSPRKARHGDDDGGERDRNGTAPASRHEVPLPQSSRPAAGSSPGRRAARGKPGRKPVTTALAPARSPPQRAPSPQKMRVHSWIAMVGGRAGRVGGGGAACWAGLRATRDGVGKG